MPYDPQKHHRRSIRLRGYDYAQAGAYFVTIVTQHRLCMFGEVVDGETRLNEAGRMVEKWWLELNRKFPNVDTDEYVVMPNHFHGIVVLGAPAVRAGGTAAAGAVRADDVVADGVVADNVGADNVGADNVGADLRVGPVGPVGLGGPAAYGDQGAHTGAPLPTIIQWFKTMTTNEYIRGVKQLGWMRFPGKSWQRDYYEHIIRNEGALNRIRRYIADNPARWEQDAENPSAAGKADAAR